MYQTTCWRPQTYTMFCVSYISIKTKTKTKTERQSKAKKAECSILMVVIQAFIFCTFLNAYVFYYLKYFLKKDNKI